ncbi:polysaccharide deacetylase family protein [Cohnella sp. WQ 127256]|uniref:polysaccharide deacetylase family protein n=1 Tax=Cohnella sp. WQ 127256 TaxID=2938790 RepID=UPI0021192CDC|nr:polysaccharide deacetylase family protein [Cohnella sp. WQ 127256]
MIGKVTAKLLVKLLVIGLLLQSVNFSTVEAASSKKLMKIEWMGQTSVKQQEVLFTNNTYYASAELLKQWGLGVSFSNKKITLRQSKSAEKLTFNPVYYDNKVIVLMYHNITEGPERQSELPVAMFRKQMAALADNGFHVISMDEYVGFMLEGKAIPSNAVLITFDDGYETFYKYAYPILKEYKFPATNFVIVKWVDEPFGRPKMSWDQMREMQKDGMSFYSHTYESHVYKPVDGKGKEKPALANRLYNKKTKTIETLSEYRARVKSDLENAERRLKAELGNKLGIIAFPYGAYNDDVLKLCKEAGIKLMFTIKPGINTQKNINAFRINAGDKNNDGKVMVAKMKNGMTQRVEPSIKVIFENRQINFPSQQPIILGNRVWFPLKETATMFGLTYTLDEENRTLKFNK